MAALVAWIYGLLWGLGRKALWQKALTVLLAFGVIQAAFLAQVRRFRGLLGVRPGPALPGRHDDDGRPRPEPHLRLQRPVQPRPVGLLRDRRLLRGRHHLPLDERRRERPLRGRPRRHPRRRSRSIGCRPAPADAAGHPGPLRLHLLPHRRGHRRSRRPCIAGRALAAALAPLFGTTAAPGPLASAAALQIVFFLAVLFAGAFAAEVSFLFGLPGAHAGKRLLRDRHPGLRHRRPDAHGQLGHHPPLP